MSNTKKILMVAFAMVGLTACGKDNYNGQYTGSEVKVPQQAQQQPGGTPPPNGYPTNNYYMGQQFRSVTANLSHNGDIVTGDYTIQNNMYGQNYPTTQPGMPGTMQGETYRFEGYARVANRIENVRIIPMTNMGYSSCVLEGTLEAIDDGARLTGLLTPPNVGYQSGAMLCLPTQVTLDRVGGR